MSATWAGTGSDHLVTKAAVYDGVENAGALHWLGGGGPGVPDGSAGNPDWTADDHCVTWDELATYVALESGHPTGDRCPNKTAILAWATDPYPDLSLVHDLAACPTREVDASWSHISGFSSANAVSIQHSHGSAGSNVTNVVTAFTGASTTSHGANQPATGNNWYRIKYDSIGTYSDWQLVNVTCPI